jgi:2-polyprenyl-6-methoxyphenol hydroxylase-like FAD-dependent oxidoreductase
MTATQVLVIGAGPVGLTMAAELARYGVAVRIVDKATARTDKSKALVVWSRTLELLDRAGCAEAFLATGHRATGANMVAGAQRIGHVDFADVASPYPFGLMIPQSETERLLEAHLQSLGIAVERGVEVTELVPGDDAVIATLRHPDGSREMLIVPWAAGCDGAHSIARHALGFAFEGETQDSDWVLADIHLAGNAPSAHEIDLFWHEDGVLAFFPITPGRFRMIADIGPAHGAEHRADPSLAEVQALLDRRGPGGIQASDPIWLSAFRINERKVREYRGGRVFLAGDAAHIHSPAGGQGMNTGMQDAFNLAWKLALVCHGVCRSEPLLGSYSAERSAIGDQVLQDATRLTAIAVVHNPVLQAVRNSAARLVLGLSGVRHGFADKLTEITIGYPGSPLNGPYARALQSPTPGQRLAPVAGAPPVGAGDQPRFALFAADIEGAGRIIARFPALVDPVVRPPLGPDGIWLVRPDGYVATAVLEDAWDDIAEYLGGLISA